MRYAESGKYVPRETQARYRVNEHGWPLTVRPMFDDRGEPSWINWRDLFGPRGGKFTHVAIEDVPELVASLEGVERLALEDPAFADRMTIGRWNPDDPSDHSRLRRTYLTDILAGTISRAEATGVDSDDIDGLLAIYVQLERAKLAETLDGDLLVPITLTDFRISGNTPLGDGVHIEPLTEGLQCARAVNVLDSDSVSAYLVAAATHAIVVEDISIENRSYTDRIISANRADSTLIPASAMEHVDRLVQAVHIVTSMQTGYSQILVRPKNWADIWIGDLPAVWSLRTVREFPAGGSQWHGPKEVITDSHLAEIVVAFAKLRDSPKYAQLSARRAVRAMMRADDEDRTLDATIGIEALVLDTDKNELRFRLALRAAAALSDQWEPHAIFKLALGVYDHRSQIAHGATPKKSRETFKFEDTEFRSSDIAPFLLRSLLRSYLLSPNPWSPDTLDSRVLDAIATQGTASHDDATNESDSTAP